MIFARGENLHSFFMIHFLGFHQHAVIEVYGKQDVLISRNRSRQGAPSERGDDIVTYVEPLESRSNAVLDDLYNQHAVAEAYGIQGCAD